MNRPNIFDYATKELSQDAVVRWFLQCCKCGDPYQAIGEDFIRQFVFAESETSREDICLLEAHLQFYRMDVFALIQKGNAIYPVIFENKTDTFLSEKQFHSYCAQVLAWLSDRQGGDWLSGLIKEYRLPEDCQWGQVQYLLFKTGYMYEWQYEAFNEKKAEIINQYGDNQIRAEIRTLDDMIGFLCKHEKADSLVSDYLKSCQQKKKEQQDSLDFWDSIDSEKRNNSLNTHIGQTQLFHYTFAGVPDREFERESNSGKWTAYNIVRPKNSDQPYYCFRFDWRKNERVFFLQQYRNEKYTVNSTIKQKQEDFIYASDLSRKIIADLLKTGKHKVIPEQNAPSFSDKPYDGKEVFRIYVNDENLPRDVGRFVSEFTKEFSTQYKWPY